ncbi:lantibiotic dehydratase [Streptomyces sp. NPDC002795]|uniref:lantibiotic dehydratase n=1 Tax=Streptomyces sp. NPDC002795 TaxID=3364665 RepID=UPI0036B06FB2
MESTYQLHDAGALLLRAAALPAAGNTRWPDPADTAECRNWLTQVWADDRFAHPVQAASPELARTVEAILADEHAEAKPVRKATLAVARYLLRATGRPTPFGLFAGVARAHLGAAQAWVDSAHQAVARPDMLWLDYVRRDLEQRADILPLLRVQASSLAVRRGEMVEVPREGGRTARITVVAPLEAVLAASEHPTPCTALIDMLARLGGTREQAMQLIGAALREDVLVSDLSAPMTEPDPLSHILNLLHAHRARLDADTVRVLDELAEAHRLIGEHNRVDRPGAARLLRGDAEERLRAVSPRGRSRLSIDLCVDAVVSVPPAVVDETARAATALLRLTRNQGQQPEWAAFHTVFWERYGAGSLVPVREAVDLAAGVGWPADYPDSVWPLPHAQVMARDEALAARAWQATADGSNEVRLSHADLDALAGTEPLAPYAPHVDMAVRVAAPSTDAVSAGDFTLHVRPAWTAGVLAGRFTRLPGGGPAATYRTLPTLVEGALPAQLSFTPRYPHAQNLARLAPALQHVISVGEHRTRAETAAHVIPVSDLAVMSTSRRLLLVSMSRRQVVEPVVLHALALEKQAPPLARFIANLGRGFATAWTRFDWGPLASALPCLPRVVHGRSVLSPARWRLTKDDLPGGVFSADWCARLEEWRTRWRCPQVVELHDGDRTLRLDLGAPLHARLLHAHLAKQAAADLTETPEPDAWGWLGHAHEIVMPLAATQERLPHPDVDGAPLVTNRMLPQPAGDGQPWVQAKLFTHPVAMDEILTRHLPQLTDELGLRDVWFVRYRTAQEEDHLRLRLACAGAAEHDRTARALSVWAARLQRQALASRLVFDGYRPEYGRYGTGPALEAAERVFVADSEAVTALLGQLDGLDRRLWCALGMIDVACGLLGDQDGIEWMATARAGGQGVMEVTRAALHHVRHGDAWPVALDAVRKERAAALRAYATMVADSERETVLESLLHMHHNRLMGPDRTSEAEARHAARQACRSMRVRRQP